MSPASVFIRSHAFLEHGADAGQGLRHQRGRQRVYARAVAEVDEPERPAATSVTPLGTKDE